MQITLKALRVNKGLTQEKTAKDLDVSVETWANYENGKTFPDVPMIKKIENYFNVKYENINFSYLNKTV